MPLTPEQYPIVIDEIEADAELNDVWMQPDLHPDDAFFIAADLNQIVAPDFFVWRTIVSVEEIMNTGFVWTSVDALTAGKARIWDWMTRFGTINPSKPNLRQGLIDCFGQPSPMLTAILPTCRRKATRIEKILSTGSGTTTNPATMAFEGELSYTDIIAMREFA